MNTIGQRLQAAIKSKGLKYTDVSRATGIPYSTIQNYLVDSRKPSADILIMLATGLNFSLDWLLLGVEPMYRNPDVGGKFKQQLMASVAEPQPIKLVTQDHYDQLLKAHQQALNIISQITECNS